MPEVIASVKGKGKKDKNMEKEGRTHIYVNCKNN